MIRLPSSSTIFKTVCLIAVVVMISLALVPSWENFLKSEAHVPNWDTRFLDPASDSLKNKQFSKQFYELIKPYKNSSAWRSAQMDNGKTTNTNTSKSFVAQQKHETVLSKKTRTVIPKKTTTSLPKKNTSLPRKTTTSSSTSTAPKETASTTTVSLKCFGKNRWELYRDKLCTLFSIKLTGRLGNCMFQYASLLGIAAANGNAMPVLARGSLLEKSFNLTYAQDGNFAKGVSWNYIQEKGFGIFQPTALALHTKSPTMVAGYRQVYKNFNHVTDILRREFQFYPRILQAAKKALGNSNFTVESLKSAGYTLIGIHARRGDMVGHSHHNTAPDGYFKKAVQHFKSKYSKLKLKFIAICLPASYCQNLLGKGEEFVYARPAEADVHMALLSMCHHVIMSVGSYSWWSAWLAGGDVVYYPHMINKSSHLMKEFNTKDYYPDHWTPMEV